MTDIPEKLRQVIDKAAEYELLGSLASDPAKRAEYRTLAEFKYSAAHELRKLMTEEDGHGLTAPPAPVVKASETRRTKA